MAYVINRYNTVQLTVVEDGTIDQTTDLKLVGKNYAGYGEIQNENFVFLLENFAGSNQPPKALSGQLWFDSGNNKLKFYDGTSWRTTGGAEVSATTPTGLTTGDFWWDSTNEQLYTFNGTSFILVGPQGVGSSITRFQSRSIVDSGGTARPVIASVVDDEVIHIISGVEFVIGTADAASYPGFDTIKKGLTLKNTVNSTNGVTTSDNQGNPTWNFWGTASNSLRLGGSLAADFVKTSNPTFSAIGKFSDNGLTIGNSDDLLLKIIRDNEGLISNTVGQEIYVQVNDSTSTLKMPVRFRSNSILPGHNLAVTANQTTVDFSTATPETVNIGSESQKFSTVFATNFNGLASEATGIKVGGTVYAGSLVGANNTIAIRNNTGDLYASVFHGIATSARYADLAENYVADETYEPGTVVVFGGQEEITASVRPLDAKVAGVVSTNPAYLMNDSIDGTPVALRGRVPCKVKGPVCKGDLLVTSDEKGVAMVPITAPPAYCVLGKALEDVHNEEISIIEIVV